MQRYLPSTVPSHPSHTHSTDRSSTAVKVKVNDDNLFGDARRGHICHCANCRKVAGGIAGINLIIENEKVEFPNGQDNIKRYDVRFRSSLLSVEKGRRGEVADEDMS